MRLRVLGFALAAALGSLSPAPPAGAQQFAMPKVDLDFDKQADFSKFKTYAWKDTGIVAEDPGMHARIVWYVERGLESKGLAKAKPGATPDLLVRYYARKRSEIVGTPNQAETTLPGGAGQLTTSVDLHKVLAGTLLVELQRASDGTAVWRAGTQLRSIDTQRIDAETKSAVRLLLGKYPPPKS